MFMKVQAQSRGPEIRTQWVRYKNDPFQLSFNASLRVDFQSSRVTSDGGLILVRELDKRLGFGEPGASCSLALERMQKKSAAAATGGILLSPGKQNGNPGLKE